MASASSSAIPTGALRAASRLWFLAAIAGQAAFVIFIAGFYFGPTVQGHFSAWNRTPLITGYVAGDTMGNLAFAAHVLMAALITTSGAMQLIPQIRAHVPLFHRWNGRFYVAACFVMALGGLWMIWVRGTYLTLSGAVSTTIMAILIMAFATLTVRRAIARQIASHHRWALRTFIVANGVWFQRLGYMAWTLLNQGPVGIGDRMDGPFDIFLGFACYLAPLAVLELYFRAGDRAGATAKAAMAAGLVVCAGLVALGGVGAWLIMWRPLL